MVAQFQLSTSAVPEREALRAFLKAGKSCGGTMSLWMSEHGMQFDLLRPGATVPSYLGIPEAVLDLGGIYVFNAPPGHPGERGKARRRSEASRVLRRVACSGSWGPGGAFGAGGLGPV